MNLITLRKNLYAVGHETYVGGLWDEIGKLQFDFLIAEGLEAGNVLLDLGCGSLRAGSWLIPYLNPGDYLGYECLAEAVICGIAARPDLMEYEPEFCIGSDFDLSGFSKRPDFVIAQSLFTHLPPVLCMEALEGVAAISTPQTVFYATFWPTDDAEVEADCVPRDVLDNWYHAVHSMRLYGEPSGWSFEFVGEWGHPRKQLMGRYTRTP